MFIWHHNFLLNKFINPRLKYICIYIYTNVTNFGKSIKMKITALQRFIKLKVVFNPIYDNNHFCLGLAVILFSPINLLLLFLHWLIFLFLQLNTKVLLFTVKTKIIRTRGNNHLQIPPILFTYVPNFHPIDTVQHRTQ